MKWQRWWLLNAIAETHQGYQTHNPQLIIHQEWQTQIEEVFSPICHPLSSIECAFGSVSECDCPFLLKTNFVAETFRRYKLPEKKTCVDNFGKMVPAPLQQVINCVFMYTQRCRFVRSDLTVKQHTSTEIWPRKPSSDVETIQKFCLVPELRMTLRIAATRFVISSSVFAVEAEGARRRKSEACMHGETSTHQTHQNTRKFSVLHAQSLSLGSP